MTIEQFSDSALAELERRRKAREFKFRLPYILKHLDSLHIKEKVKVQQTLKLR